MILAQPKPLDLKIALRGLVGMLALFALLFVSAGTLDYWQGWVYLVLNLGIVLVTVYVLRNNPALIEERLNPRKGMKAWDKRYFALTVPLYIAGLVIAGADVGRFHVSPELSPWVYAASIVCFILGQALFLWAKQSNAYFSSVVRIQLDRGQTVCREGPYRYVRHPGYVGSLVWTLAAPLMLGSLLALVPAVLSDVLLLWRTAKEDDTLQAELPGYVEYANAVRYRLIPGIW